MGNISRKHHHAGRAPRREARSGAPKGGPVNPTPGDIGFDAPPASYSVLRVNPEMVAQLRAGIANDPEGFLLDQLLLSITFLPNYKEELSRLRDATRRSTPESPLYGSRKVLIPDALHQAAGSHIRWRPKRNQPDQLLRPRRHFVLHDNILVHPKADTKAKEVVGPKGQGPIYHLAVHGTAKPGQVKLRRVKAIEPKRTERKSHSWGSLLKHPDTTIHKMGHGLSTQDVSRSPVTSPVAITVSRADSASNPSLSTVVVADDAKSDTLCESCHSRLLSPPTSRLVKSRTSKKSSWSVSSQASSGFSSAGGLSVSASSSSSIGASLRPLEEFRLGALPEDINAMPAECFQAVADRADPNDFSWALYLSAPCFMASFGDLFSEVLAEPLGFSRESVVGAMVRGPAIVCDQVRGCASEQCEVVPALRLPSWPRVAAEWVLREREPASNQWPSPAAVHAVHQMGAVLIPSGRAQQGLTWGLAFPAAERVLELSLSSAQIHAYMILLTLHRGILDVAGRREGFTADHLRAFLFWEVEQCPVATAWPVRRPGFTLRQLLDKLYAMLQGEHLPDYFVRGRNLLDDVPRHLMRRVQEKLFRVREKLFVNVLQTLRNLTYVDNELRCPAPDFNELVKILTENTQIKIPATGTGSERDNSPGNYKSWIQDFQRRIEEEERETVELMSARNTKKKLEFTLQLGQSESSVERTRKVLIFFARHLVKMGIYSSKFEPKEQAWTYLEQSLHLAVILEMDYGGVKSAREIYSGIQFAETRILQRTGVRRNPRNIPYDGLSKSSTPDSSRKFLKNKRIISHADIRRKF